MSRDVLVEDISAERFEPFGDLIDASGEPTVMINQGRCGRYHDQANLEFGAGNAAISVFEGTPYVLPLDLDMMERHPLGSQAFIPMSADPYLAIVAPDENGTPGKPVAFRVPAGVGVNYHRNTWHAVLTPLGDTKLFAVIDRVGDGDNLEEFWFDMPWRVVESA